MNFATVKNVSMNEIQHMAKRKYFGKLAANSYVPFVPFHMYVFEQSHLYIIVWSVMSHWWLGFGLGLGRSLMINFSQKSMVLYKTLNIVCLLMRWGWIRFLSWSCDLRHQLCCFIAIQNSRRMVKCPSDVHLKISSGYFSDILHISHMVSPTSKGCVPLMGLTIFAKQYY